MPSERIAVVTHRLEEFMEVDQLEVVDARSPTLWDNPGGGHPRRELLKGNWENETVPRAEIEERHEEARRRVKANWAKLRTVPGNPGRPAAARQQSMTTTRPPQGPGVLPEDAGPVEKTCWRCGRTVMLLPHHANRLEQVSTQTHSSKEDGK